MPYVSIKVKRVAKESHMVHLFANSYEDSILDLYCFSESQPANMWLKSTMRVRGNRMKLVQNALIKINLKSAGCLWQKSHGIWKNLTNVQQFIVSKELHSKRFIILDLYHCLKYFKHVRYFTSSIVALNINALLSEIFMHFIHHWGYKCVNSFVFRQRKTAIIELQNLTGIAISLVPQKKWVEPRKSFLWGRNFLVVLMNLRSLSTASESTNCFEFSHLW